MINYGITIIMKNISQFLEYNWKWLCLYESSRVFRYLKKHPVAYSFQISNNLFKNEIGTQSQDK